MHVWVLVPCPYDACTGRENYFGVGSLVFCPCQPLKVALWSTWCINFGSENNVTGPDLLAEFLQN